MSPKEKTEQEFRDYKNAVWKFMLEHCDILPTGKIFVKFHTDGQQNFEKRIVARYIYHYHREDVDSKQQVALEKRGEFLSEKQIKKQKYLADKTERRAKQNIIKKQMDEVEKQNKMSPLRLWVYRNFKI